MYSSASLPPDLATIFNRFSNEELHQIGLAFIQQSQYSYPKQQKIQHLGPSQHCPRRRPPYTRPPFDGTIKHPLSSSTPRRPASDSFDNNVHHPTLVPPRRHPFNINVLKRAVSNNFPCFFINFHSSIDISNIPSCTQVAITLKKFFANNHLSIKDLSMCIQIFCW